MLSWLLLILVCIFHFRDYHCLYLVCFFLLFLRSLIKPFRFLFVISDNVISYFWSLLISLFLLLHYCLIGLCVIAVTIFIILIIVSMRMLSLLVILPRFITFQNHRIILHFLSHSSFLRASHPLILPFFKISLILPCFLYPPPSILHFLVLLILFFSSISLS